MRAESGRALAAAALYNTKPCRCGRTQPATVTRTIEGSVRGYCHYCLPVSS